MSETRFDPEILADNLRCKVIFYSCFTPKTISDLNTAWGYSSPTYLYQQDSLEQLKDANLITVEKEKNKNLIQSNHAALFNEDNLKAGRNDINTEIMQEFLLHSKGFQPRQHHAADERDLLDIGRGNLDEELEAHLQEMEFDADEYATLAELWQTTLFREVFLSLDIVTRLFEHDKDGLPDNPLEFFFKMTAGTAAAVSRAQGDTARLDVPKGLMYRGEKIIVPAYRAIDKRALDSNVYTPFVDAMRDSYSLFRSKFRHERFHHTFIEDFIDVALQRESEKRFGNFIKKYRSDDGLF